MNKLTKVGCSALCGSLAAIASANAGTLTVTGGADLTFTSLSGQATGTPIGMGSNLNFKGSGELDNGWLVDLTIAEGNSGAFSAANITVTMGGLGKINFNHGNSGNGIQAMDDKMPTAWEEAWGAGLSGGVKLVTGSGKSQNVMYSTPKVLGTEVTLTYAADYGASDVADKATQASGSGSSYDATVNINPSLGTEILSGLNLFAGASTIETHENSGPTGTEHDQYQGVGGVTYDIGPLSLGAQVSAVFDGETSTGGYYHTYKNTAYGVAFNINDDFSVSYGKHDSYKAARNDSTATGGPNDRLVEVFSWQAAYTMGGASFRIADTEVKNNLWSAGKDLTATTISVGLAF